MSNLKIVVEKYTSSPYFWHDMLVVDLFCFALSLYVCIYICILYTHSSYFVCLTFIYKIRLLLLLKQNFLLLQSKFNKIQDLLLDHLYVGVYKKKRKSNKNKLTNGAELHFKSFKFNALHLYKIINLKIYINT